MSWYVRGYKYLFTLNPRFSIYLKFTIILRSRSEEEKRKTKQKKNEKKTKGNKKAKKKKVEKTKKRRNLSSLSCNEGGGLAGMKFAPCSLGTRTVKSVTTRERNTRERKPEKSDTMSDVMRINCSFISIKRQCRLSLINTNLRLKVHMFYSNVVTRAPYFFFFLLLS